MKLIKNLKIAFLAVLMLGGAQMLSAQELGVRFGSSIGSNVALDAVFSGGKFSRIHADIAFGHGVGVEALYDFIYRPLGGEAFRWYMGFGVGAFFPANDWEYKHGWGSNFMFGLPAEIGLEYRFKGVPLAMGVDWRPMLVLVDQTDFYSRGFGFNVRFCF